MALYPYVKKTDKIALPPDVEKEMREFVRSGNKIEAIRRVIDLSGAGLKVSKDYVDQFETTRPTPWLK